MSFVHLFVLTLFMFKAPNYIHFFFMDIYMFFKYFKFYCFCFCYSFSHFYFKAPNYMLALILFSFVLRSHTFYS